MSKFFKTQEALQKFLDENYNVYAYYADEEDNVWRIKRNDKDKDIKYFQELVNE